MLRTFDEHIKRKYVSLDGVWKFKTDEERKGKDESWHFGLKDAKTVVVPSVWNTDLKLLGYEGQSFYERDFFFEGGTLRLSFGAVMTSAEVFLDGELLGTHYGGFSQFDFIVKNVSMGYHKLVVLVDNSFDKQSIPQKKVDWYHYGGIVRGVDAEKLCGISILNYRLEYDLSVDSKTAACRMYIELYNADGENGCGTVKFSVGDKYEREISVMLGEGERREIFAGEFELCDLSLWDIGRGNLYTVAIETETDDLYDKVGFRKISVENGEIVLNGRPIEIRGVNRHEEHPDFGFAFPASLMARDIDIIEDLGCNAIRGSHYPMSHLFIDMLDEKGILFWSEIPMWGWGFSISALGDEVVVDRGLRMHEEMVKYYYNHPSIIIFGMHNEIHTEDAVSVPLTKKYYEFLKENGGNRIVTYATDKPLSDLCLEYCDLIAINAYHGWYGGTIEYWADFLRDVRERRDELGLSHKPVIFSEFGAAALYGHHTFDDIHWTEEYQARLLTHAITLFKNDSMCRGYYIWQFTDMRTCLEAGINRARGFNNKGILNEYRKPKAAYYAVKKLYTEYKENES